MNILTWLLGERETYTKNCPHCGSRLDRQTQEHIQNCWKRELTDEEKAVRLKEMWERDRAPMRLKLQEIAHVLDDEELAEMQRWIDYCFIESFDERYDYYLERTEEAKKQAKRKRHMIRKAVREAVWRRDGSRCVECGRDQDLHIDHIIPHSRGGSDTLENLQIMCAKCNLTKGNRSIG